ncbi:MAG: YigZ family protein [Flavobacteriaceae bacterium]
MEEKDTYSTIEKPSPEILYKDKKSKFLGFAFPVSHENEIKPILESLRMKHPNANHLCYAWQLGVSKVTYRANDDGEPNNSAGMPIYGQILSFGVTNILIVIVRFFGGTKLGVGGLIQAYRTTAKMALESALVIEKKLETHFNLHFEYPEMERVMRAIRQRHITVVSQKLELKCAIHISVVRSKADPTRHFFEAMQRVRIQVKN